MFESFTNKFNSNLHSRGKVKVYWIRCFQFQHFTSKSLMHCTALLIEGLRWNSQSACRRQDIPQVKHCVPSHIWSHLRCKNFFKRISAQIMIRRGSNDLICMNVQLFIINIYKQIKTFKPQNSPTKMEEEKKNMFRKFDLLETFWCKFITKMHYGIVVKHGLKWTIL